MAPGAAGVVPTVVVSVVAADDPQTLSAVTVTGPPVVPTIAEMELDVLVPDHPPGRVQV